MINFLFFHVLMFVISDIYPSTFKFSGSPLTSGPSSVETSTSIGSGDWLLALFQLWSLLFKNPSQPAATPLTHTVDPFSLHNPFSKVKWRDGERGGEKRMTRGEMRGTGETGNKWGSQLSSKWSLCLTIPEVEHACVEYVCVRVWKYASMLAFIFFGLFNSDKTEPKKGQRLWSQPLPLFPLQEPWPTCNLFPSQKSLDTQAR